MAKIPFKFLPAAWGLKGKPYDIAEANYYFTGKELDVKLLEIEGKYGMSSKEVAKKQLKIDLDYGYIDDYQYAIQVAEIEYNNKLPPDVRLKLELEHNKIDQYEYDKGLVALSYPENSDDCKIGLLDVERSYGKLTDYDFDIAKNDIKFPDKESLKHELGRLEIEFNHGNITKTKFEKETATLKEEPWVDIVDHGFDPKQGVNGVYFEFDWNDHWVEFLRKSGYIGYSDEQVVEQWFSDVCRTQVDGNPVEGPEPQPFNSGRAINRVNRDDGGAEYS